jgi:hypothetical protein
MGKTLGRREKLTGIPIGLTPLGAHPTRVKGNFYKEKWKDKTGYTEISSTGKTHRPDTVRCASD